MERFASWLLVGARILLAVVFLLNGFGVIDQAIPAKEMTERGVPPTIVPLAMFAGRFLEVLAGFGLALGIFPMVCIRAIRLSSSRHVYLPFFLAGGWHTTVSRTIDQFL